MSLETVREASRLTAVPARTIRRWIEDQRLTARRRGRAWLVDPQQVSELAGLRGARGRLPRSDKKIP